ncbi:MAG: hypothetical protein ACP5I1_14860 [Candidatus Hinthialibacter sp.]
MKMKRNVNQSVYTVAFLFLTISSFARVGIFDENVDIGEVGVPGSAVLRGDEYEVIGSGVGIGDIADGFHFVYKEMNGPFMVTARLEVDPFESASQEVKAALMVRDSLEPDAVHFDMFVRNDWQLDTQWRETAGGNLDRTSNYHWRHELIPLDVQEGYVQIVRLGNTLMSYYIDYDTGQPVLHETRVLENIEDPVYVGLAVTSNEMNASTIGYFAEVNVTEIPFLAQRIVPQIYYKGGTAISGIKIQLDGLTDSSTSTTVVEKIPADVTAKIVNTTIGTAQIADDEIIWDVGNATGTAEMTYDLIIPSPGAPIICTLSGDVTKGGNTIKLKDVMLKHEIGLGPDWEIGANGVWAVIDGVLKHYADSGLDPKHIWVNQDFGTQDYTVRADVMMTSWIDDDLSRSGVMIRCSPEPDSQGSREMALNLMFHEDLNSVDMLNDHIEWASKSDYAWELNEWYTMELTGNGTLVTGSIVKKGDAEVFNLEPWDKPSNSERVGYPGLAGSTQVGLSSQFDNFEVIVDGSVIFSDNFDVAVSITNWSLY